jgi:hypothetical protein
VERHVSSADSDYVYLISGVCIEGQFNSVIYLSIVTPTRCQILRTANTNMAVFAVVTPSHSKMP